MADAIVVIVMLLAALPALYLLYLAFTKPPPVSDEPRHRSRWVWYAVQAAVFLVLAYWLISINTDAEVRPSLVLSGAAALTFYLIFSISMYLDITKRLWRWFTSTNRQRRINTRR